MLARTLKNWLSSVFGLASSMVLTASFPAHAQTPAPLSPAQFDPSDVYFQGYLMARSAEELEAKGDFSGAMEKLEKAQKAFESITRYYPNWKPEMVGGRSAKNTEAIAKVRPKSDEQRFKNSRVIAELEGGVKNPGILAPSGTPPPSAPSVLEVDPLMARRLAEAEAEVKRLRSLAQNSSASQQEASRNESRVQDLARQRDVLQSQLNAAENNLNTLKNRLATNPMEAEMKALNQRIAGLEQERQAMSQALTQSRGAHTNALAQNAILEADLKVMQQKRADLDRDLKAERNVANSVVAGQRTQLQALEKELEQKSSELGKANERISGLMTELQQSKDAFATLRGERDSLLQERDQMSAMLKLNEEGRINDLIQQNMGLAKNLREANEKVERLNIDNNSTKDEMVDALRDLALAKSQINRLHQEKREQDNRLVELKKRLESEEKSLSSGQATADPAEVEVLRDLIKRQLSKQERRRQASEQLIAAAKEMGVKDEQLNEATQLLDGQEIELTPDEQRLLAEKQVDNEFVSPFAQDRATVGQNTNELNREIAIFERTAEKSFAAGQLLPTRVLFQLIAEKNPGYIPALSKLGLVNIHLKDYSAAVDSFRRAVELDDRNSYAHQMLGYSLAKMGDLVGAEKSVKAALELEPGLAKSHFLLGTIVQHLGRLGEAEAHYKDAVSADPTLSDPFYNLALLCQRDKRLEKAREYYGEALERGGKPDPALEQAIAQSP